MKTFLKSSPPLNQCLNLSDLLGQFKLKLLSYQRLSSIEGHLTSKVAFHPSSSSIDGFIPLRIVPPLKVFFHQRSSSIKGHLPPKVIFHRGDSSMKGHQSFSSIEGLFQSQVNFHQIKGCHAASIVFKGCIPTKVAMSILL